MDKMRLSVDQLVPGMKLDEPVTGAGGVTLMPVGLRLTPMLIARIRKWNIGALDVIVEKRPPDTAARRAAMAKKTSGSSRMSRDGGPVRGSRQEDFARAVTSEISRPFVNVKDNPLMMTLRAAVIKGLIAHGRHGAVNILRHRPAEEAAPKELVANGS